ncbi:MAG: hypothetical protein ACFBSC_05030 [Microcoleaceae cyanobacterium]
MNSSTTDQRERVESLKIGILAGTVIIVADILLVQLSQFISGYLTLPVQFSGLLSTNLSFDFTLYSKILIVGISGFLFGVTYRYAVRSDQNFQLKSGVVAAFGLVRGLAEIESILDTFNPTETNEFWLPLIPIGTMVGESLVLFVVTGIVLDFALKQGWIQSLR